MDFCEVARLAAPTGAACGHACLQSAIACGSQAWLAVIASACGSYTSSPRGLRPARENSRSNSGLGSARSSLATTAICHGTTA